MNKLFVISGSSGVGKGTIINNLLDKNSDIELSISTTTRNPRPQEQHGVHYFYVSKEDFKTSIKNNEFLEWAEFSENFYGTKQSFVDKCLNDGKNLLLEIDTQGALQIKEKRPESILIFIAPPSIEELERRLKGRMTEDENVIKKRLNFVKMEQENSKKYDYIVINDEVKNAVEKIENIIKKECNG